MHLTPQYFLRAREASCAGAPCKALRERSDQVVTGVTSFISYSIAVSDCPDAAFLLQQYKQHTFHSLNSYSS